MDKIQDRTAVANLPVVELEEALAEFLAPVTAALPDVRLRRVLERAVQGIVGSQSPVVTDLSRKHPQAEDGLDVEEMRVQKLERMRRLFVLVLLATLFVYRLGVAWPHDAIRWLRCPPTPRGRPCKLGMRIDRDGPYILLAGIRAVFVTAATLTYAAHYPFPNGGT